MVNFKDTFEQYKNGFDGNLKKFTSFHKGIDLTAVDFINREKSEWLKQAKVMRIEICVESAPRRADRRK